eukprot:12625535-Alexandrium_andersonii.AAC.1
MPPLLDPSPAMAVSVADPECCDHNCSQVPLAIAAANVFSFSPGECAVAREAGLCETGRILATQRELAR